MYLGVALALWRGAGGQQFPCGPPCILEQPPDVIVTYFWFCNDNLCISKFNSGIYSILHNLFQAVFENEVGVLFHYLAEEGTTKLFLNTIWPNCIQGCSRESMLC